MKQIFTILFLCFLSQLAYSQLGLCNGNKGNQIFNETFGSGLTHGPALASGITSYTYSGNLRPVDGQYTIYFLTNQSPNWHNSSDHTPDIEPDGFNGKCLILNAGPPGEFYKRRVTNLCDNTDYEFSSWIINLYDASSNACSGTGRPVDVSFEIWNASETVLIKSGSTGAINGISIPVWSQYGLTFTTLTGQNEVVLKLKNNGVSGCGNDLALDDIVFRPCNDLSKITSSGVTGNNINFCPNNIPSSILLNLIIANSASHVYQWQESVDNINWIDIVGQTGLIYTITNINSTKFFRVKVAQNVGNLSNPNCLIVSENFKVLIDPKPNPPTNDGDKVICSAQPIPALTVSVPSNVSVNWYDTSGNLLLSNSTSFTPTAAGTYYAEAFTITNNCLNSVRTPLVLTINNQQQSISEINYICENQTSIQLDAVDLNGTYLWSTPGAETTQTITVNTPGIYNVKITNPLGCFYFKTITVIANTFPVIANIDINEDTVTVLTTSTGNYEYSIDEVYYQSSNVFYNLEGGWHTAYVRGLNNCGNDYEDFLTLVIPKYFTPNDDAYNDFFEIEGLSFYKKATVAIFDRYGKLLKHFGPNFKWNGTYNGKVLPASDYWYKIDLGNGKEIKGHFTLKR